MGLVVLRPGLHTTVQDLGRPGYRASGVPVGGAFDRESHGLANALVGNDPNEGCATLEMTLVGGSFRALTTLALALAGAPMRARVEGAKQPGEVAIPSSFTLCRGDRLIVEGASRGVRTYLAVAGGFRTSQRLGCRSWEEALRRSERLDARPASIPRRRPSGWVLGSLGDPFCIVRFVDGPDTEAARPANPCLDGLTYRVDSRSNRIGLRLDGPIVAAESDPDRLSAPVAPGAIQIAGGRPLILGVACGTMGGYPHVGHVISADLPQLAQARPGERLTLRRIEVDEARRIDRETSVALRGRLRALATLARDGRRFLPTD